MFSSILELLIFTAALCERDWLIDVVMGDRYSQTPPPFPRVLCWGSGCCCGCSGHSSLLLHWSEPPPSPLSRPLSSWPAPPVESIQTAGRAVRLNPQTAAERREEQRHRGLHCGTSWRRETTAHMIKHKQLNIFTSYSLLNVPAGALKPNQSVNITAALCTVLTLLKLNWNIFKISITFNKTDKL